MNDSIDPTCRVHVIAVSSFPGDHIALAHMFGHTAWKLTTAQSVREAAAQLSTLTFAAIPVVVCDENLSDGSWKDLLRFTQGMPDTCNLIVTSSCADDRLWAEVLQLGAYDVLQKPFRAQELFRTVGRAWSGRRKAQARSVARAVAGAGAVA